MRGRKPTPTAILKLRNSWRSKTRPHEPKPEVAIPPCPKELNAEARREWRRITKLMKSMGTIAQADLSALCIYCISHAELLQAQEQIDKTGLVVQGSTGTAIQNPYIAIRNSNAKRIISLLSDLGLSPSARTRLHVEKPDQEKTELDRFLKETR